MAPNLVSPNTFAVVLAILFVSLFGFVLFIIYIIDRLAQERASKRIDQWCSENNFKLVSKELDWLSPFRGPFVFDLSRNRPVYVVTVKDQTGELRKATIACWSRVGGYFSNRIEVVWDCASSDKKNVQKPS
jgi:hypothetical protein